MIPPHLPPKTCSIATHHHMQSLPWLLFVITVTILTSVAVALIVVTFVVPSLIVHNGVPQFVMRRSGASDPVTVDTSLISQTRQRVIRVYNASAKINDTFYTSDALVAEGVMLSLDGWAVIPRATYKVGEEALWEGIDYRGVSYTVRDVAYDPTAELLYIRFAGDGFRIMTLAPWERDESAALFAVGDDSWQEVFFESDAPVRSSAPGLIWQLPLRRKLLPAVPAQSIVVNNQGEFVGFVDEAGNLQDSWMVSSQIGSILEKGSVDYQALPWTGYMVTGIVGDAFLKSVDGFYVTNAPTRPTTSTVGRGDVVTAINRRAVESATLSQMILFAPNTLTVTVLRGTEEVDIPVTKVAVE